MADKNDFFPSDKGVVGEYLEWSAPHKFPGKENGSDHEPNPQFTYRTGEKSKVQLNPDEYQPKRHPKPYLDYNSPSSSKSLGATMYDERAFRSQATKDLSNLHSAFFVSASQKRSEQSRARRESERGHSEAHGRTLRQGGHSTRRESAEYEAARGKSIPGGKQAGKPAFTGLDVRHGRRERRKNTANSEPSATAIASTLGHSAPRESGPGKRSIESAKERVAWAKRNETIAKAYDLFTMKKFLPALAALAGPAIGRAAGSAVGSAVGSAASSAMSPKPDDKAMKGEVSAGSEETKVLAADAGPTKDFAQNNPRPTSASSDPASKVARSIQKWDGSYSDPDPAATLANVERIKKAMDAEQKDYSQDSVRFANDHKHNLRKQRDFEAAAGSSLSKIGDPRMHNAIRSQSLPLQPSPEFGEAGNPEDIAGLHGAEHGRAMGNDPNMTSRDANWLNRVRRAKPEEQRVGESMLPAAIRTQQQGKTMFPGKGDAWLNDIAAERARLRTSLHGELSPNQPQPPTEGLEFGPDETLGYNDPSGPPRKPLR